MGLPNVGAKIVLDGEKEYRKSVADINADMRVLGSEMKKVSSQFYDNANSVNALEKKNDVLNKQLDKQREKVNQAREALKHSAETYGENDNRTRKWQTTLNNAEADLSKLNREIDTNEKRLNEARTSSDKTATSIDQFGREVKAAESKTLSFSDVLKANLVSGALLNGVTSLANKAKELGTAFANCATDAAAYADDIVTMSKVTGISTDKLQEYKYGAELVDVSVETMTSSMRKNIMSMQRVSEGNKIYAETYRKLGVNVVDASGKLRDSEDVYWDCIDALGKMKNETERDATSLKLFGKSAQDLNPMILEGSKGMKSLADEAKSMGAVMDKDALKALNDTQDASDRLDQSMLILKRSIGEKLAPYVTDLSNRFIDFAKENKDKLSDFAETALTKVSDGIKFIVDNARELATVAGSLVGAFAGVFVANKVMSFMQAVSGLVTTYRALKTAQETATVAQTLLNASMSANPVGLLVGALGLLVGGLVAYNLTAGKSKDKTVELTQKQKDLYAEVEAGKSTVTNLSNSIKENSGTIKAQFGTYEDYAKKLDKIVSKDGEIKKGHEDEAKYLTGELADALGIRIDIINNKTIPAYDNLKKKIKEVMLLERAKKTLEANDGSYIEATKGIKAAATAYASATENYKKSKVEYEKAWNEINTFDKEWDKAYTTGDYGKIDELSKRSAYIDELRSELSSMADNADKAKSKMNDAENSYVGFTKTINNYTKLQDAIQSGNKDKIKRYLDNMTNDFITAKSGTEKTLKSQLDTYRENYNAMELAVKKGLDGVSKTDLAESKKWMNKAQKAYDKKIADNKIAGEKMGKALQEGIKEGLGEKVVDVSKAVGEACKKITEAFKVNLEIHSPSRITRQFGVYVGEGFEIGTRESMAKAKSSLTRDISSISAISPSAIKQDVIYNTSRTYSHNTDQTEPMSYGGDLIVQLVTPSGEKVFETVVKEFRKAKKRDNSVSLA